MPQEKRPLFREYALQQYMHRREKDILPRILMPPTFLLCWLFFAFLFCEGLIAWWERVPVFVSGTGTVSTQARQILAGRDEIVAIILLPASNRGQIHNGSSGLFQFSGTEQSFSGTVLRIEAGVLSPKEAQSRYRLSGSAMQAFTQPMIVVDVGVQLPSSMKPAPGTSVQAEMQTGSKRILSLLPGFDGSIGA